MGGSTEASALARALAGDARFAATLSLAGRTSAPATPPVALRLGGFGGVAGLVDHLRATGIAALVDATHPFAARMRAHAAEAAEQARVPRLAILRPPWRAELGDRWTHLADSTALAGALAGPPRRVFLAIGQQEAARAALPPGHFYLIRSIEPPDPALLPPGARSLLGRGPFALADEIDLLRSHRIDTLVAKNSGGAATAAKLEAARLLGIEVLLIARPPAPPPPLVADAEAALAWLARLHAERSARGV